MRIYLDWSIFSSIKNPTKKSFTDLKTCIERLKDSSCIPYSSAHLSDLSKGFKKNEEPFIGLTNADLQNLSDICNDEFWFYNFKTKSINSIKSNPFDQFEEYKSPQPTVVDSLSFLKDGFGDDIDSFEVPIETLNLTDEVIHGLGLQGKTTISMKELLKAQMNILSSLMSNPLNNISDESQLKAPLYSMLGATEENTSLHGMMLGLASFHDENRVNPSSYKELRDSFKAALEVPDDISNWGEKTWERLDALCLEKIQITFTQLIENSIVNQKLELDFNNMLLTAFTFLDLFSYKAEKLSKKNTTANMSNDSMHALFASLCDIYVCDDGNSRAKTKVVYSKFGCKTLVLNPEEFLNQHQ